MTFDLILSFFLFSFLFSKPFLTLWRTGQNYWLLTGWDRGNFSLIFSLTRANYWLLIGQVPKILAFDWLSARAHHLHFASVLKRKAVFELDFELVSTRISLQSLNLAELVGKNGMEIGWKLEKKFQKVRTWMFYGKQQMVICFKTTKNRARGSFATQINLVWVLSVFCQWTSTVIIS